MGTPEARKKKRDKKVEMVRRVMRKHRCKDGTNDGRDRDATSVTVPSDPNPMQDNDNLIYVGGIADFHERIVYLATHLM